MKRNKLISLLLISILTLSVILPVGAFPTYAETQTASLMLGDSTLDQNVNIKDATNIQKSSAKIISLDKKAVKASDVDSNNKVNIKDATNIQKWLANLETGFEVGKLFEFIFEIISEGGFVLLNINPEIRIAFDTEGFVTNVEAHNKEAEAILDGFEGFEGKACKEVVDSLIVRVKDAGYLVDDIDGENKLIVIQLESGSHEPSEGFIEDLRSSARNKVKDFDAEPEIIKIEQNDYDKKYETETEASPFITLDKAVEIALAYSGVWAEDAKVSDKEYDIDRGTPYYEIEFLASGFEFECKVNALNGKIEDFEKEKLNTNDRPSDNTPTPEKPQKTPTAPSNESFITFEEAKAIALADAKVAEAEARFEERDFDLDDGTPYYEIEFSAEGFEYEYKIHAVNGKIIKSECEPDDDYHKKPESNKPSVPETKPTAPEATSPANSKPAEANTTAPTVLVTISQERAKEIVLAHAGVEAEDARFTDRIELDYERETDTYVYEIEFSANRVEYEYTINAVDGTIIDFEADRD